MPVFRLSLLLAALAPAALVPAAACARPSVPAVAHTATLVTAAGRTHQLRLEVARTEAEQARGLMYRRALAPDAGMIFPMTPPRPASFWMKNTLIPLDLLFIRADGTIARVARSATPLSLAPIESGEPVAAVLEIAGGRADALGVREGDRVRWR